jgi:nucleotide-binding universal stress UspA family protein
MIRDIAVQLTGSSEDEVRLTYAEPVARTFDAHITGLQVHALPEVIAIADVAVIASAMDELLAQSEQRAVAITQKLEARMIRLEPEYDLRRIDANPGAIGHALAAAVRNTDLFVGTRPYGDPTGQQFVEEQVLFESGRGCLFVPPKGTPPKQYGTILVAWKESREAARAVAEALPFLMQARQVMVALVEEQGSGEQHRIEAGADIGRYLSRHGVSAEIRKIGGWSSAGEALLHEATATGADMIVMGGYGHSRFREFVLGGATRHVLTHATVPVLMAH